MADNKEKKSWYNEGLDDAEQEAAKKSNFVPWRFRLKQNEKGQLTFLSDQPFSIFEHQLKLNGKWGNFFSCLRTNCPLCKAGNDPAKVYIWAVVDHRTYTDKKGNQHTNEVRLFVAKPKIALRMKKLREKNDGLRGLRCESERTGGGFSFSTGDQIDAEEKYSEERIRTLPWWPKQKTDDKGNAFGYDWGNMTIEMWAEIFTPKEPEDLRRIVRAMTDEPEEDTSLDAATGEEEIPWR